MEKSISKRTDNSEETPTHALFRVQAAPTSSREQIIQPHLGQKNPSAFRSKNLTMDSCMSATTLCLRWKSKLPPGVLSQLLFVLGDGISFQHCMRPRNGVLRWLPPPHWQICQNHRHLIKIRISCPVILGTIPGESNRCMKERKRFRPTMCLKFEEGWNESSRSSNFFSTADFFHGLN